MDHPLSHPDPVQRLARIAGPFIVVGAAVAMLAWTWLKWPDPVVDFGRELYVPWQISEGKVLYRDIAYFNGPLSPYFNAQVFRVLGVSLRSLVLVNLLILAGIIVMIWRLWVIIADPLSAMLACLLVVTLFAFVQFGDIGNYNFVTPYSHEMTHGIALSLAGLLCVAAYLRGPRSYLVALAGLLVGLIFLTKPEMFLAGSGSIVLGMALALWWQRASCRRFLRVAGQFLLSAVLPAVVAFVLLMLTMPPAAALRGTLGAWQYLFDPDIVGMLFYRRILGISDLPNNLHAMIEGVIWWTALFGAVAWVALSLRSARVRQSWMWLLTIPIVAAALALIQLRIDVRWDRAFRGLSLVTLVMSIGLLGSTLKAAIHQGRSGGEGFRRLAMQFVVSVFALLLLMKVFFNVMLMHYGFALAMPAMLLVIALLASWWPNWIDRLGGSGVVLRAATVVAVIFVIQLHLSFYWMLTSDKQTLVGRGADAFLSDARRRNAKADSRQPPRRGHAVNLALASLERLPSGATLATIPEGAMINYLARRVNPTPYINLMPPEVLMFGEDRIGQALDRNPPDYVLLVLGSNPSDFGYKSFASDYGASIFRWIQQHYRPLPTPQEPTYPLMLMERRRERSD